MAQQCLKTRDVETQLRAHTCWSLWNGSGRSLLSCPGANRSEKVTDETSWNTYQSWQGREDYQVKAGVTESTNASVVVDALGKST